MNDTLTLIKLCGSTALGAIGATDRALRLIKGSIAARARLPQARLPQARLPQGWLPKVSLLIFAEG